MQRIFRKALLPLVLLAGAIGCSGIGFEAEDTPAPIVVPPKDLKELVDGNRHFAFDLYRKLRDQTKDSMIFSPYSISSALAMTSVGARGQTADEMRKTLHFTLPGDRLHTAMAGSMQQLQPTKEKAPFELTIANAIWGQSGFEVRPEFLSLTKQYYSAGYKEVPFRSKPDEARQTINRWVEQKTKDRIRDLLGESDITPQTRMVLTNAIYFKGVWQEPFPKSLTQPADFEISTGEKVKRPMMHVNESFAYFEGPDFQLLRLPYQGQRMGMVVVLPRVRCGLAEVEKQLTSEALMDALSRARAQQVQVSLPKFKVKDQVQLAQVLAAMGMPTAVSENADFTGISAEGGLAISGVVHQAEIDVDEEGTVAAAATAVVITRASAPLMPVKFVADHPFFFALHDQTTESLLFLGRFVGN